MAGAPELAIVIPTLGRTAALQEVIDGLRRQQPPLEHVEVFVVLDADAAATELGPAEDWFPLRVLTAQRPGASANRNTGWQAATAPLILFLDDDIIPTSELVAEHRGWHQRHPEAEVGVLGAVRWSPAVKVTPFMRWLETGIQFDHRQIDGIDAGWGRFYTCNVSVKRSMLERVDGFDERVFPFGYEDLDISKRMTEHGFRLLYNERAVGEHLKSETLEGWRRNLRRTAIAERRFVARYPEERPYFYERFQAAAEAPVAHGRTARLARFVGPGVPWLGRVVWRSYDLVCSQRLASEYLAEWDAAEAEHG